MRTTLAALALLVVPLSAAAQARAVPLPPPPPGTVLLPESPPPATAPLATAALQAGDRGAVLLGAKVGGVVPFDKLGAAVSGSLEVGWLMPWMDRRLAAVLEVSYAQPTVSGSATDPRVGGAAYGWKLVQRELVLAPTISYRLHDLAALTGIAWTRRLVPYVGVGPRVYLLESVVSGSAGGQPIPTTTERSTKGGLGVPAGAEYAVGPGRLVGELLLEWGALDLRATGSGTSTAGMTLRLGYRMLF